MADLEDDSLFREPDSDLTSSGADASKLLKGAAYRISRRIFRGGTYYLTRNLNGMDVEASLLNENSNDQIWNVKPHIEVAGLYTITSFEDPDLSLTYDTSSNDIIVDGVLQTWTLDVRGSQIVIGDFSNDKAIDLDRNIKLDMKPRSDSLNISDHSQRWTFTIAKDEDPDEDLPPGLQDWPETTLESGLYFVMNETDYWYMNRSTPPIGILTSQPTHPVVNTIPKTYADFFLACAFVFNRNDDGSYYITNWYRGGLPPTERFLQVSAGCPAMVTPKSKCHLYRDKTSNTYVISIFDLENPDTRAIVFDPPPPIDAEKIMGLKSLNASDVSGGGVLWRVTKVYPP